MKKMKHYLILLTALLVSGGVWGVTDVSNENELRDALLLGGEIRITANEISLGTPMQSATTLTVSENTTLNLNGHYLHIYMTASSNNNCIAINAGKTLTITGAGKIYDSYTGKNAIRLIRINKGATLAISPGAGDKIYFSVGSATYHTIINKHTEGIINDNGGYFSQTPYAGATEYAEAKDVQGKWYKKQTTTSDECKIGEEKYATIAEAMSAAAVATPQYPTITLLKNATCSTAILDPYVFDGSSYTLTVTGAISAGTYSCKVSTTQSISGGIFNDAVTASEGMISGGSLKRNAANIAMMTTTFPSRLATNCDYATNDTTYLVTKLSNLSNHKLISGTYETSKIVGSIDGYLAVGYTTEAAAQAGYVTVVPVTAELASCKVTNSDNELVGYFLTPKQAESTWNAANGNTLTLLKSSSTDIGYFTANPGNGNTLYLDLNGHTLIANGVTGTIDYSIGLTSGTLQISGGEIQSTAFYNVQCESGTTLNINSGTYTASMYSFSANGATININDGTFMGISAPTGINTLNIFGGTSSKACSTNNGTINVYGGELTYLTSSDDASTVVNIHGGSVNNSCQNIGNTYVSGGFVNSFFTDPSKPAIQYFVTGGEFGFDPTQYLVPTAYKATQISQEPICYRVGPLDDDDPGSYDPTGAVAYIQNSEHYKDSHTYYKTLEGVLRHARNNDEIFVIKDITLTSPITVDGNKKVFLHLERHTITNNVPNTYMCNVQNRAHLIIVGNAEGQGTNAQLIIPAENTTSKGFFKIWNSASAIGVDTLDIYNVTMTGATDEGHFINCESMGANVKLQDVDANMTSGANRNIIKGFYCNYSLVRGTYTYSSTIDNEAVFINEDYKNPSYDANSAVSMENVIVHSNKHVVIETMGENNSFINCTFDVSDGNKKFYTAGFSLSNGGTATINSGTFIGGTGAYIYSSGGTLNLTGGYYEGRLDNGAGIGVAVHAHQERNNPGGGDADAIMNISGGNFKGSVKVTSSSSYLNAYMYISGGTFSDVSYDVTGKKSLLEITGGTFDADPSKVGQAEPFVSYVKSGYSVRTDTIESKTWYTVYKAQAPENEVINWSTASDWNTNTVPTASSAVSVTTGKSVTISSGTTAQALSISLEGSATITVEEGAKLVVEKGGVTQLAVGDDKPEIIVKDGGYLYFSPETPAEDEHPFGTVNYQTGARKTEPSEGFEHNRIWQHIGIPTMEQPTIGLKSGAPEGAATIYLNTWSITDGWTVIGLSDFDTPFKGYNFSNNAIAAGAEYTFAGRLVGSKVNTMVFTREGYTFFGNSFTAPVNIRSMLLNFDDEVQRAVYLYDSEREIYDAITVNNAGKTVFGRTFATEIKPMRGFFIYSPDDAEENLNYQDAVWNFALTVAHSPERGEAQAMDGMAIQLSADNGRSDITTLMEGAEYTSAKDDDEVYKMKNPAASVELYTVSENGKMAIYAAESLDQTALGIRTNDAINYTIAFDNVTVEDYELVDQITGTRTAITDGATYTFNASANTTIDNRLSIRKITGEATGVGEVENAKANDNVYTVLGQFVGKTADWDMLPAGVYMVNGVKLVK